LALNGIGEEINSSTTDKLKAIAGGAGLEAQIRGTRRGRGQGNTRKTEPESERGDVFSNMKHRGLLGLVGGLKDSVQDALAETCTKQSKYEKAFKDLDLHLHPH